MGKYTRGIAESKNYVDYFVCEGIVFGKSVN